MEWCYRSWGPAPQASKDVSDDESLANALENEAGRRNGSSHGKHGLSPEEEQRRRERQHARDNYYRAVELNRQFQASKGEGKKDKSLRPKPISEMPYNERWYLENLWSGSLYFEMRRAEGKCSKVQAKDFVADEEE